jgi:hypothetical protein
MVRPAHGLHTVAGFFVYGLPGLPAGHGRAMKPLSDFSPNIGGLDIGISPAAPAGERGHPGKGTR